MGPIYKVHPDDEKKALIEMLQPSPRKSTEGSIDGVIQTGLIKHWDERGYLEEVVRASDGHMKEAFDPANDNRCSAECTSNNWGQTYVVCSKAPFTKRGLHKHGTLFDWFYCVQGMAKVVVIDDREESETYQHLMSVILSEENSTLLRIPPGCYHGWINLIENTKLICTGSHVYQDIVKQFGKPDESRIGPMTYGDIWSIKGK